jgi:hypothetical protein
MKAAVRNATSMSAAASPVMKRTAEKQLRAYISAKPANIEFSGRIPMKIHMEAKNTGQTPAYDVVMLHRFELFPTLFRPTSTLDPTLLSLRHPMSSPLAMSSPVIGHGTSNGAPAGGSTSSRHASLVRAGDRQIPRLHSATLAQPDIALPPLGTRCSKVWASLLARLATFDGSTHWSTTKLTRAASRQHRVAHGRLGHGSEPRAVLTTARGSIALDAGRLLRRFTLAADSRSNP